MRTICTELTPKREAPTKASGCLDHAGLRNKLIAAENALGASLIAWRSNHFEETMFRAQIAKDILTEICPRTEPIEQVIKLKDDRIKELMQENAKLRSRRFIAELSI